MKEAPLGSRDSRGLLLPAQAPTPEFAFLVLLTSLAHNPLEKSQ